MRKKFANDNRCHPLKKFFDNGSQIVKNFLRIILSRSKNNLRMILAKFSDTKKPRRVATAWLLLGYLPDFAMFSLWRFLALLVIRTCVWIVFLTVMYRISDISG